MKNQETAWLLKDKYHGVESEAFQADCARLESGVPLAYLIGSVPFLDCTIYLDSHPLIPRTETEYWVEQAIAVIKSQSSSRDLELETEGGPASSLHILDLCAGSGAIGVAVAKAEPSAHVTFAEIDPAHLPTIEKNIVANLSVNRKVGPSQYSVLASNLFEGLKRDVRFDEVRDAGEFLQEPYSTYGDEKTGPRNKEIRKPHISLFDFILTNPPYIDAAANTVDENVVEHEPHLALFGGDAGMEIITRIIAEAPEHLAPTGQLWIEHEPAQTTTISKLAGEHNFLIITHADQYRIPRFSVLTMAQ